MILKIFKAVWFLSLLGLLVVFMIIYASLPEQLIVQQGGSVRTISREAMFYTATVIFALCNVLVFIMSSLYRNKADDFLCWFYGLIITLNVFFVIALNFLNLYNSNEKFNFASIGFIIYGSVLLVVLWAISWPFYSLIRKKEAKSPV